MTDAPRSLRSIDDDHAALTAAVREAGAAALARFEARRHGAVDFKPDGSPVSDADRESNEILRARLLGCAPAYGWLSEESAEDPTRRTAARTWIVDPIDGTRAFLSGGRDFSVCVALVENGSAVASAVFCPGKDEFYEARLGGGARLNGEKIRASARTRLEGCRILASKKMLKYDGWPTPWPAMDVAYRASMSYRFALLAAGRCDAVAVLARCADWDVAPGALIAAEAGAKVSDHLGRAFQFNRPDPRQHSAVAAASGLHPALLHRLAHLPEDLSTLAPRRTG